MSILRSPETHVSYSLLNTSKEMDALPTLRTVNRVNTSDSTHPVLDAVLVLDTYRISYNFQTQERMHPPDRPPSPNLFYLLEHQTSVNDSVFFPFPLLLTQWTAKSCQFCQQTVSVDLSRLPISTYGQTTPSLPLALILMPPQEFSAESTDIITSIYLAKARGFWTRFPPSLHIPGLRAYTVKACTGSIPPNPPRVLWESH